MSAIVIMQNMWVKDPAIVKEILNRHPGAWQECVKRFLFSGCKTGRIFQQCWSNKVCELCVWDESTFEIADNPRWVPNYDGMHMLNAIKQMKPNIIILVGKQARDGFASICHYVDYGEPSIFSCQHPCARGSGVLPHLREIGNVLKKHFGV